MRAVHRILGVLECFRPGHNSLTLQEIADGIDLPKSTAFRIVQSLHQSGYLVRLHDQRYCLSFRFIRLAGLVESTLGIREIARPIMVRLAEKTKETVAIHTIIGRDRVCIDTTSAASSPLRSVMQPGMRIPLRTGSGSKTLMAFMPEAELVPMLTHVVRTTKRARAEVLSELVRIRRQGFAVSHGERLPGMSAISAPITDAQDQVRYCLTLNGPTIRIKPREKEFVPLVVDAAQSISLQFGG